MKRRTAVGLAIAPGGLTAVVRRGENGEPAMSATTDIDALTASSLALAFRALAEEIGTGSIVAHVAILPPLVELKTLQMPPVRRDKLNELLEARITRSFLTGAEDAVVAAEPVGRRRGSPVRVAATCTPEKLVESVLEAADEAGWVIRSIASGYDAVAAAASRLAPDEARELTVPLVHDDIVEWLHVVEGRACCVRRGHGGSGAAASPRAPACGAEAVANIDALDASRSAHLGVFAARHAHLARGTELVPRAVRTARTRAGRRAGFSLLATVAVVLIIAAWAELQGIDRELHIVQEARAGIATQVEAVLAQREQLATMDRGLALLSTLETSAPDWTTVLADVADRLPDDASITWMHGLADSLKFEGTARDASGVLESLRSSRVLSRVRADAPFERESTERGEVERFRLAAEISPRSNVP